MVPSLVPISLGAPRREFTWSPRGSLWPWALPDVNLRGPLVGHYFLGRLPHVNLRGPLVGHYFLGRLPLVNLRGPLVGHYFLGRS